MSWNHGISEGGRTGPGLHPIAFPRNALVRRFDHHPGIYYLRQCMAAGVAGHGQPQMILEQLCQLLRGSGRVSEEHLRMIAPRPRIGLFWG